MPVLEAMACGLPVIATGCSALCDFMTPENSYSLAVDRLVAAKAKCPYYQGFRWAEPSHKDLRRLMRHVWVAPEVMKPTNFWAAAWCALSEPA